jgi:transposase
VIEDKLSLREAAERYGISSAELVRSWIRIFQNDGPDALVVDRRKVARSKGTQPIFRQDIQTADKPSLIAEIKRLRAENDYLKKLRALVLAEEQRNKRRGSSQN